MYEDEAGNQISQEENFTMNIKSPFTEMTPVQQDNLGQWWLIVAAVGAVALGFGAYFFGKAIQRRRPWGE